MDDVRRLRFLIPPFFLIASLLWGLYLDPTRSLCDFLPNGCSVTDAGTIIGVLAGGGIVVISLGFLIGAVSIVLLRILFQIFRLRWFNPLLRCFLGFEPARETSYEAAVSAEALRRLSRQIRVADELNNEQVLFTVVTFVYDVLHKQSPEIHEWLLRRSTSFAISIHSCVALVTAHLLAYILFAIAQNWQWYASTLIVVLVLFINGILSWREVMGMTNFQALRNIEGAEV